MTAEERTKEHAAILAAGVIRARDRAALRAKIDAQQHPDASRDSICLLDAPLQLQQRRIGPCR